MISETQFRRDLNMKFSQTSVIHDLSEYGIQQGSSQQDFYMKLFDCIRRLIR
ncbi:unnamed protein product [Paramecium primaurelia]|uniref:Uncharacterized protein n=1 Tax=Paramecium primaurelia TaxID=5886 RepID=A0A8S1N5Q5_PARPR|nr:unnamed protein product [Paramecium primaurelia]